MKALRFFLCVTIFSSYCMEHNTEQVNSVKSLKDISKAACIQLFLIHHNVMIIKASDLAATIETFFAILPVELIDELKNDIVQTPLDQTGRTLLHYAHNNEDVHHLVTLLASPQPEDWAEWANKKDKWGNTPLNYYIKEEKISAARELLVHDALFINKHDIFRLYPLSNTVILGNSKLDELLSSKEAAFSLCHPIRKLTPLQPPVARLKTYAAQALIRSFLTNHNYQKVMKRLNTIMEISTTYSCILTAKKSRSKNFIATVYQLVSPSKPKILATCQRKVLLIKLYCCTN